MSQQYSSSKHEIRRSKRRIPLILEKLESVYHSPRLGNKDDPLDELFYIIISLQTSYWSYEKVFDSFKKKYQDWSKILVTDEHAIEKDIEYAGLSKQKSRNIKSIVKEIADNNDGIVSLEFLGNYSNKEAIDFLTSMLGVGVKTAKCVLMYSLGRDVFPVDTHIFRIFHRLGLASSISFQKSQNEFEKYVPDKMKYGLHVNMVAHGRETCKDKTPLCDQCVIKTIASLS